MKQATVPSGTRFKPTDVVNGYDSRLLKQVCKFGTSTYTLTYQYSCK